MLPSELISSLPRKFEQARGSGDLVFYSSTVSEHVELGVKFQVTHCPALQSKPQNVTTSEKPAVPSGKTPIDPFSPPYNPNLYLGDLNSEDGEYVALLNKFSVIPEHFLLVTKDYQSQSLPLMPPELAQVYQLLSASRRLGKTFAAFYNCGEHSGASQPHKHIQFIPVKEDGPPIESLARSAVLQVQGL